MSFDTAPLLAGFLCLLGAVPAGCASSCPHADAAPPASTPAPPSGAPASAPAAAGDKLDVALDLDGQVRVDGKAIAVGDVAAAVRSAHPDPSRLQVTLFADDRVPHGDVTRVLDQLRQAGVLRIGIVVGPAAPVPAAAPPASAPDRQAPAPVAAPAAPGDAPPAPTALPEVKVENIGLHIGGGPNDDASKLPFKQAIEPHFDAFRKCYALVDEPAKGGTFGVDLRVARDGGKPEVKQPRTGMKGKGFRECMVDAFREVEFERPHKPVVFSYSLRFTVGG